MTHEVPVAHEIGHNEGIDTMQTELIETSPIARLAIDYYGPIAARAAATAFSTMRDAYGESRVISEAARRALKIDIDNESIRSAINDFVGTDVEDGGANFDSHLVVAEGDKEGWKDPEDEVETGRGIYRPNQRAENLLMPRHKVALATDIVDGTTWLSKNIPGATTLFSGIVDGDIMPVRSEDEAQYREGLVAGRWAKGLIDLEDAEFEENVLAMLRARDLLDNPGELTMRILGGEERRRNHDLIERGTRMGLNVDVLDDGDAAPMFEAMLTDDPVFSAGSGGKDESTIAAVLAHATGAHWQGSDIVVDKDTKEVTHRFDEVWNPEDVVKGKRGNAFLIAAGVTGNKYINLSRVKANDGKSNGTPVWDVDTLDASASGHNQRTQSVHILRPISLL